MKHRKSILGALLILCTYFPATYGANETRETMQVWALTISIFMIFAGLALLIDDNI